MSKYLIVGTRNKKIPYARILHEVNAQDICLIVPEKWYSTEDLISLKEDYGSVFLCPFMQEKATAESVCFQVFKSFPYQRLITHTEKDILWAARLRDLLHIKGQPYKDALLLRDKLFMKEIVSQKGFKTPNFSKIESSSGLILFAEKFDFPIVVKPRRGTGSEGIHILNNLEDIYNFSEKELDPQHESSWLAESYIEGTMYQIDAILEEGEIIVAWPSRSINRWLDIRTEKMVGRYFLEPENIMTQRLIQYAKDLIKIFPVEQRAIFHIEVFHTQEDALVFCEIASRVGGLRGREAWIKSFNIDLGAQAIRAQAGLPFDLSSSFLEPQNISGYLLFPKKNGSLEDAPEMCPISGVQEYTRFINCMEKQDVSQHVLDLSCVIVLTASSEKEYLQKTAEISKWYERTYKWKEVA